VFAIVEHSLNVRLVDKRLIPRQLYDIIIKTYFYYRHDAFKMLCLNRLTRIVYILLLTTLKQSPVYMRTAQIKLFVHVKILQKTAFFEKVWPSHLALFVYDSTHYVEKSKKKLLHQTAVREVPGSILCSGMDFNV